ncbi:MAG TPA: type II CAAX endopeptidase family protein [Methylomirabilota bacterium]|nr:type II CAAX endopeptidase family protein [Methylomirabilota bacterium]
MGTLLAFTVVEPAAGQLRIHKATRDRDVYAQSPSRYEVVERTTPLAERIYVEREAGVTISLDQVSSVMAAKRSGDLTGQSRGAYLDYTVTFVLERDAEATLTKFLAGYPRQMIEADVRLAGTRLGVTRLWSDPRWTRYVTVDLEERSLDQIKSMLRPVERNLTWTSQRGSGRSGVLLVALALLGSALVAGLALHLRRQNPMWLAVGAYAIAWCAILMLGLIIRFAYAAGYVPARPAQCLEDLVIVAVLLSVPLAMVKGTWSASLRLKKGGQSGSQLVAMGIGAVALNGAVANVISVTTRTPAATVDGTISVGPMWNVLVLGVLYTAAIEIFFRGYIQARLRERCGAVVAIVAASAFYVLFSRTARSAIEGVYFGYLTEKTGSVRAAIVTHVVSNVAWDLYREIVWREMMESQPSSLPAGWAALFVVMFGACLFWLVRTPSQPGPGPAE